jgi:hypothetical protein
MPETAWAFEAGNAAVLPPGRPYTTARAIAGMLTELTCHWPLDTSRAIQVRLFKMAINIPPLACPPEIRLMVTVIAEDVGYQSEASFSRARIVGGSARLRAARWVSDL